MAKPIEELLKEMMSHGLLVFKYETDPPASSPLPRPKFVLMKVPTPADPRDSIEDASMEYFATCDEALDKAQRFLEWEEEAPIGSWQGTIMYKHALGPRFEDLGVIEDYDYRGAMIYFNRQAESYICEYGEELGIGDSEVKVRPA